MPQKTKVLFIARKFPPSVGGMERFAYELSEALKQEVELSKITWGGSNKALPLILPWFLIRALITLWSDSDLTVIHMQDCVQAPVGWLLSKLTRRPYLCVAHGLDITYESTLYQKVVMPFVRRADKIVAISSATEKEAISRGVNPNKITVLTLGIDDQSEKSKTKSFDAEKLIGLPQSQLSTKKLLLTTGRLVKRKGVAWFVQSVMPKLVEPHPEIIYLVVGKGTMAEEIERIIKAKNLTQNVRMLGEVSEDDKKGLYELSDVFVMPNIKIAGDMEGFGIVAIEAASFGLPVVTSDLEGIKDAIKQNKNGILVKSGEPNEFIQTIESLLYDPKISDFGTSARYYTLEHYSWPKVAKGYHKIYEEMTAKS